jgi:hypothetical protein
MAGGGDIKDKPRYAAFQMAEVAIPRQMFQEISLPSLIHCSHVPRLL